MKKHRDFEIFVAAAVRHEDHFPRNLPLELQVIKGHLLVERCMREILDLHLVNPDEISSNKSPLLGFHQAAAVLAALTPKSVYIDATWLAIRKLNSIRNKMAHELSFQHTETEVKNFLKDVEGIEPGYRTDMPKYFGHDRSDFELAVMCIVSALSRASPAAA
jgi:hypothetical protein